MFQKIGSLGLDNPQLDEITASKSAGHHLSYCFVSKTIYLNSHIFCVIGITVLIQPIVISSLCRLGSILTGSHPNRPQARVTVEHYSESKITANNQAAPFPPHWLERDLKHPHPLIKPLRLYEDGLSHSIKKLKKKPSSFLLDVPDARSIKC